MLKKRQIVMLPAEKAEINQIMKYIKESPLHDSEIDKPVNSLTLNKNHNVTKSNPFWQAQHLYIFSNEEIKEGDWYYDEISEGINKATGAWSKIFKTTDYGNKVKKIIAITDPELHKDGVAKIPHSFIEEYITEYNKGSVIEWVNVEYQKFWYADTNDFSHESLSEPHHGEILKLHKDNTIIIHKIKDSWTKEEHITDLKKLWQFMEERSLNFLDDNLPQIDNFDKWIEENL